MITVFTLFVALNTTAYIVMWVDKIKAIYAWWRISERTLWILALIGGVFGIWLGMSAPLYHKAGKKSFRIVIPLLALLWCGVISWYILRFASGVHI